MTLERKVQIGFAVAVVIIVAVGAAALRSTAATVASARWVAHALEVRGDLEAMLADLIDAETGVRGYLITGDTTYLAPYDSAGARLEAHLAGLRALTADNPVQLERLDSLATLVAVRLERFHWTIETRRSGGPGAAGRAVIGGRGKELMQLVRSIVGQMEDEEGRLLAQRSAQQTVERLARRGSDRYRHLYKLRLDADDLVLVLCGRSREGHHRAGGNENEKFEPIHLWKVSKKS